MMVIDTLQQSDNGSKYDVAPVTVFDAVLESDKVGSKNLTEVISDVKKLTRNESCIVLLSWEDGNLSGEDRVGKFVTIPDGSNKVRVATDTDIAYGVVVDPNDYADTYPEVLLDTSSVLICVTGKVVVRCRTGYYPNDLALAKRVVISEAGNATISNSTNGFTVLNIVDNTHIMILFIPYIDMITKLVNTVQSIDSRLPKSFQASVTDGDLVVSHDTNDMV